MQGEFSVLHQLHWHGVIHQLYMTKPH